MGTTALLAAWLGTNVAFGAACHARARRRRRAHGKHAARAMRARARAASHEHGRIPVAATPRARARVGLPFPIDLMEARWRAEDEVSALRFHLRRHAVVAVLLEQERAPEVLAPHARPGQPMAAPYDWATAPESMGVRP